jgi:hypothetical protein
MAVALTMTPKAQASGSEQSDQTNPLPLAGSSLSAAVLAQPLIQTNRDSSSEPKALSSRVTVQDNPDSTCFTVFRLCTKIPEACDKACYYLCCCWFWCHGVRPIQVEACHCNAS